VFVRLTMPNEKILVTGADGFIGSHLVERLVCDGFSVKAFVQYNSFNSWGWLDNISPDIKKGLEIFSGDVRDPFGVKAAMADCHTVMHLASLIAIPYSYHSPQAYVETNVVGTLNVLQAAREIGVERVIHTSTSEVYGTAQYVPINEMHPVQGQSPYSATKIAADQMAFSYYTSFNLPVITLRPFNTYGPRQSARAVIPSIIIQILKGERKIKLGALSPTRDFSYVDDTVAAFISALGSNDFGQVMNLGSNFEISIADTASLISQLIGSEIIITQDDQRLRPEKSEVNRLLSDNSKAMSLLEWKPTFAGEEGFKQGLMKTIQWFSCPENLSSYKADIYNI